MQMFNSVVYTECKRIVLFYTYIFHSTHFSPIARCNGTIFRIDTCMRTTTRKSYTFVALSHYRNAKLYGERGELAGQRFGSESQLETVRRKCFKHLYFFSNLVDGNRVSLHLRIMLAYMWEHAESVLKHKPIHESKTFSYTHTHTRIGTNTLTHSQPIHARTQ